MALYFLEYAKRFFIPSLSLIQFNQIMTVKLFESMSISIPRFTIKLQRNCFKLRIIRTFVLIKQLRKTNHLINQSISGPIAIFLHSAQFSRPIKMLLGIISFSKLNAKDCHLLMLHHIMMPVILLLFDST